VHVAVRELSRRGSVVVNGTEAFSSLYLLAIISAFTPDNAAARVARMSGGDVTKKRAPSGEGARQVEYCLCSGCVTEELCLETCDLFRHEQTAESVCLDGLPSSLASILSLYCGRTCFRVLGFVLVLEAVRSTPGLLFSMHI